MPSENGKKALNGERVWIEGDWFEITEDMTMTFEGRSCNVLDSTGHAVYTLRSNDGEVTRDVLDGYRCYVLKAFVEFKKKNV
jgi:hypothetical protein